MDRENKIKAEQVKKQILELTKEYWELEFNSKKFVPGESKINYAGRTFNHTEMINLVDSALEFWLTEGKYSSLFSEKLKSFLGAEEVILVNSGSSANLLALSALTSEKLGCRKLNPGDEVITLAAGFPTTVAPILQNNLVPVFVDIEIPTYNIDIKKLEMAVTEKTRCLFLPHTLGNPFNVKEINRIVKEHDLWLIEDNCDALGSLYNNKLTGTFGHISTLSFYPAHHITSGEGGAVVTSDVSLARIIKSMRDWGRDCFCSEQQNISCGKRFTQKFGDLPEGYDHKYVYSEVGYNLKMTDLQAAIGAAQIEKLEDFSQRRRQNFERINSIFKKHEKYLILPSAEKDSDPSWFCYILTVKENAPFSRENLTKYLNENLIETRNLFAGNITKQPAFMDKPYRIAGELRNSDFVMNNTFFMGTYPGLMEEKFKVIEEKVDWFFSHLI